MCKQHFTNKYFFVILICSILVGNLYAQDYTSAQNKIKSIYVYNFMKYIKWPVFANEASLKICVLSDDEIFREFIKLSKTKSINHRSIVVERITSLDICESCDLIFVGDGYSNENLTTRDSNCKSFIITDGESLNKISNIKLVYNNQKLAFIINEELCTSLGYKIASQLQALALKNE